MLRYMFDWLLETQNGKWFNSDQIQVSTERKYFLNADWSKKCMYIKVSSYDFYNWIDDEKVRFE